MTPDLESHFCLSSAAMTDLYLADDHHAAVGVANPIVLLVQVGKAEAGRHLRAFMFATRHSRRSAVAGSMQLARCAGNQQAAPATASRVIETKPNVSGSSGRI